MSTKAQAEVQAEKTTEQARKLWESAKEADGEHPYLKAKAVPSCGMEQDENGNLVVPVMDTRGKEVE